MMNQSCDDRRTFVLDALVEYETRLVRYATRLLDGDQDLARDIVQHAFLKLCEQPSSDIKDRVGPWLFQVCRNRAIDERRRLGRSKTALVAEIDQVDDRQTNPGDIAESADLHAFLQTAVSGLPEAQREVIDLWSLGLDHNEVADVVEKKPGAVRGCLHRAIQSLKSDPRIKRWLVEQDGETKPAHSKQKPATTS